MCRPESWRGVSGELVYEVARVAPDPAPFFEDDTSFVGDAVVASRWP
jgi:hypothetical protein